MYKSKRQVNRKSFDWYGLSQRFSIRKYHFGAASVLLGTALILGSPQATAKADETVSADTTQTSSGQGVDTGTNSATDGLKNVTLPTASTTEAAVLEKPTLSDEEIAKLAATSETPAITSTTEKAKEESKPAASDAVVKTNAEEKAKTDKLTEKTEKETKAEEKAEKKEETASQKTILTQLTSEAEVLNTTAANYAEKKVEDKASKDAIASAVAAAKTEIAASKKALEAGEITKAELDAQLQRISSAIEAVYAEMKRGGHIGKVEAMLADVSSTINLPERTIVKRVNDLTDTEVEEIIRQIRIANPNLTKNDIITVDRGASTSAASGGATITFANGDTARLGAGDILTGIGGAKNADTLRQAINWFEFSSATIVYPDGTQAGPARYLDNPINMQVDSPDGTGKMTGRLTMVRDVIYTDGSKGLTTDERFKNLGVAEYSTHKYYTGGYQNNNEVYEVLKEGMVLKVPTRVEGYQLTLRVDKLGPKPVATDPNNTATRGKNAKGASEGVNKYKPVKMIMTTQDTTYSYLKQAGMDITVPDRDSSGNPIAGTSRPALAAITPNWDGANAGVTFSASATYNGVPVPVNLVASDGEEGGRGEFLQFVTNGSNWEELMALNLNKNGGYVYGTNKLDLNGYLKLNENGYNIDEWVTNPQAVDEKGNLRFADSSKTQRIMDVYGTKEFGPAWTAMRQGNALPIGFSQNVSQFSMYMHSTGAQAGTIGFITFDGGDAPESYGKAQHVIGNINKTLSDGRQVTASQPFLGDQPGDPDFRSTSDEHDKTGAWVLDDLVNTAKHRQVDVKTGNEISNESGDTGTYAIVNGNPVIRKTDGSTVAIKTGEIVTVKNPDDTFPIRGIFDTASQSVGVGSLPDEGRGQLLDSAVATDYKLRQATDNEYVLDGVRANLGQNNDVAYVRGWVDFNGNGKFDDGESSEAIELRQNKTISLKFKNTPQLLNTSIDSVGVRLRIALDKEEILKPTGLASSGEVEDFLTHVIHPPRGTRTKTKNYQGEKQSLEMTTSDLFTATGKTDRSKYQNWNQIDQTIPPKIVVTESVVAKEVPTGDADVNVTDPSGTTVYRGTVVKVYDKRNNELGTAVKVTNPLNGTTEYLLSNYTEYDTAGNKVGVYSLNKENNGLNKADSNGIYKTKIEFTPELGYVGTAKGIAIRAWDENRVSTGWSANDKTIEESKRNITLADKDKILANVNEDVNGRESMDTTYVPTVVDIKPVGKDETTTDVQGKEQSATPKIPDHGTVESITDSSVDESKISKEHVLIDKTKPITFAHEKVIPGKVYTKDTKVTEETVLTYEDGGTETFKPADKIPAGTEIAKNSPVTITGEGNVTVSGVRIANEGTTNSPNKVPAGSVLEGAQPTAPQPIKVLRNGVEVTVNTGEKLKVGDQLVDPLPITSGAQITTWKVTLQKGDVIPQSYSTLKPTLAEATGVDKITGTKGATLTYDGNKYVYNNDTIPQGTKTVGTTVDLSTLTLPNATHVDPATGVVTTVPRRYTTISDNKIVIENEGTYTIVPKTSTNEKGQTIYEDAKVVFTPDPKFVGVGTGVTLKQPDLDYNTRVDGDKVTSRYGTDYGYAKYTPVVTPDLTATITRKIHYVYEGDKSTPATAKKPILTIDDKPVVNEQTLTYNRDYIIMEKDGVTEKDIKVANVVTLNAPIKIKRFVKENNQTVEKEITTNTLQPGDEVKAGTQLSAGTVIIGAWKPINDENAKFTPIISPVLKGYTAEVQLPSTEYTKKEENGVQTHVRNANSTPAGIYTPSAPGGNVDTVNVGAYEPLVSVVRADDKDDFDVYVYYKADKQKANVVYIDLDEKGDKRVLETQSGTKVSELPTGTTQDPKTTYGVEKLSGESDSTIPYDTADTIKKYTDKGYELASDDYKNDENGRALADGRKFDEDSSVDQTFYVYLRHKKEQLSTNDKRTVTRHIEYKYADTDDVPADKKGQPVEESLAKTVTEVLTFERIRTLDMATTAKLFENEYNAYKAVLANNAVGSDAEVDARANLFEFVQGEVNKPTATDEVKAIISYGEWQAKPGTGENIELSAAEKTIKDSKFNDVVSPTVPGYLPDNAKVEATADVNPESDPDDYTVTVTYSPGDQKAIVNFVEVDRTNTDQVITPGLAEPVTLTGKSGAAFPTTANDSVQAKIAELVKKGYELVDNGNGFVSTDSFDTNSAVDQTYTVKLRAKEAPVVPTDSVTPQPGQPVDPGNPDGPKWPESVKDLKNKDVVKRTIKYVYEDGIPVIDPATGAQKVVEQTAEFTRPANVNLVTGAITYGDWTPAKELAAVASPTATDIPAVANHIVSTATVPAVTVAAEADDITETVVYRQTKPITVQPNDPTPTKDQPIDPNNPDGPKWTEELLKKLEDARKEEVNRTITYKYSDVATDLKADDAAKAGTDVKENVTVTNTVTFKRPVTIDPQTGEFTYGDWVATNGTTLAGKADLPVVPGYVATGDVEKSKTDVTDVKATDKDITDKVVYKALGKFVPVVPEGFTPPTIENPQYPNNNDDPSKPGTPTTTIPYVPGTTPVGPDGQPLKPKVEGDPKQGYVPPAPTTPTGDTTILYVKDGSQVAVTHFIEVNSATDKTEKGAVAQSIVDTGDTGKAFTKGQSVTDTINALKAKGYTVVENGYPENGTFDSDVTTNQEYKVLVTVKEIPVTPDDVTPTPDTPIDPNNPTGPKWTPELIKELEDGRKEEVKRTINYVYADGTKAKDSVEETKEFKRSATINPVTGKITFGDWSAPQTFEEKQSPAIDNYTPNKTSVEAKEVTATADDITETVIYSTSKVPVNPVTPDGNVDPNTPVPNDPKGRTYKELGLVEEVTRTVHYVYEDGTKAADDKVQTITFTRTADIDPVTGALSNIGTWTVKANENTTFESETTDPIAGYIASAAKSTEVTGVQATDKDTEETIIYRKLGSYVPVVPAGVTPPADFDKTPKPYPNATPEDPTRPGTPTTPTTTIPEIPGTTPVGPDGTPLTKNPNGGYDLPPVPTDPTQNTTITYVKDGSQVAVTHFIEVNSATDKTEKGAVAQSIVDTGDTGKAFTKGQSVTDTINALKAKGYTVVENGYPENGTFDSDVTTNQEYKVLVTVKEIPVTPDDVTPTPDTPIDPNNPTGPKWTPELIKELEDGRKEEVKRTIKYIYSDGTAVEDSNLTSVADKKETTLTFKRSATINPVIGKITFGDWSAAQTFEEVTSPTIENAIVDRATVPAKEVTATADDINELVVYKKLGSYIPVVPDGVTVPPGTDTTAKVYPKNPNDPTKPGTPTTTIPEIPGTTPVGPNGTPLTKNPNGGYDLPPVPADPTQNTTITYVKDGSQVAVTHFIEVNSATDKTEKGAVAQSIVDTGDTGKAFTKGQSVTDTINALKAKGYTVVENGYPENGTFDSDVTTNQEYKVLVTVKEIPVTPDDVTPTPDTPIDPNNPTGPKWTPELIKELEDGRKEEVKRTINYIYSDGTPVPAEKLTNVADKKESILTFKRSATINPVTGKITFGNWTPEKQSFEAVTSPSIDNYTPNKASVEAKEVTPTADDITETVIYSTSKVTVDPNAPKDPSTPNVTPKPNDVVPNDPKGRTYKELGLIEEVTRTVHYVYEDGTKAADDKVQTITFTRTAEIDTVTGAISNFGTWTLKDENNTFEPETTEAKAGYVASAAKSTEVTGVQATDKDTEETIIYRKLGSYVPVVPAGVTPPANFDKTPKPYPNATPEDPTRPGTPTTPTTTIPEIPGTTPVGPDGTPLTKNPNGGYDLPPVPTDPTQNTTITYVKDGSQVAVVHFVDEKGRAVNESVVETGDTGNTISKTNVDAVKAKLEAKGYVVVEPTDALYTTDKEGFYKEETRKFDAVSDKSTGTAGEKVPSQQYYVIVKAKEIPADPTKPGTTPGTDTPTGPTTPENGTPTPGTNTPAKPGDKIPGDPLNRTYGDLGLVEEVTRTINYVKNDGSKAADPVKETLTFTRKAKINAVTGEVTYLAADGVTPVASKDDAPWTAVNGTEFKAVKSPTGAEKPELANYTPTKAEVEAKTGVTATDEDIVETVVYNPTTETVDPKDPNFDPEKPLNPNNPNGLKYKDLKLTEEVARTITYTYADDVADTTKRGTVAAPEFKTTVSFTRTATINKATGEVTYSDWAAKDNDTTLEKDTKDLPSIPGYVATGALEAIKKDVENVNATDKDITDKIVYKDLGKYVPVVPEGTTPPTIENPKYPNHPTDPTKPGEPTTTIPNVPGLTPLDPSTGKPLEPKDPNDLTKGYKPPVPQVPSENTNIVYVPDGSQVSVVHFVDEDGKAVHTSFVEAGNAGAKFAKAGEVTKVVDELKAAGYVVVPNKAGQAEYPGEAGVFDSVDDKGKDGVSQVYYVTVAKTIPVTPTTPQNPNEDPQNPNPGDPINPKNPNGPKWTEDALNKLNNIKSVTRTITYVKDSTDEEVSTTEAPKVTNKVSFTRTVVINPKDGSVVGYDTNGDGVADVPATDTTSGWTAAGTAKFAEVKSPVVKGYVVKPNQDTQGDLVEADGSKVKASTTDLTVDSPNQDLKVRYVPVGTWTPKVPDGETPIDPIPYPNDPKDPGKVVDPNDPTTPNDPNKPSVPVIPHIPGTTPKDPNGNPLKPVDPKDPSKGYVPPTPKTPTENTEIKYEKDTQKAVTKFKDPSGNPIPGVNNIEETGKSGEPLTKETEVTTEITKLIAKGYDLVSNNYGKDNNGNFDKDSGKDQEYTVVLTPHVEPIKPFDPTNPNDPNTPKPGQPIDPKNPNGPKWTPELIKQLDTTKHVTRTITYVDDKGNKVEYTDKAGNKSTADVTDKVTFTREAKINVVTGTIEYGKWTPVNNDTTFDKVTSPVVPGYVLKDPAQKVVESKDVTETTPDETIKVVYVPVGKLVPKVPDGVTPPTPTPYDNDPQDPGKVVPPSPTKPQDPQDPNSPKVPVIPHIPGTTPKVPQDPTKPVDPNTNPLVPLKPVDPKDPSKGYEVPPVPTNPGTDTPIVYENDKQKAITNFVDNNGKVVSDPVVDQGDSGSKFTKSGEVAEKIKELLKKGYVVTSNDYPSADKDRVFDNDKDKDQIFNVKVTPLIVPTDPNSPDKPQVPTDPTKPVGPNNPLKPVTPSNPEPGKPVFPEEPNSPVWPPTVKDMVTETTATRTITYVDHNGKEVAAKHTETIKFKRTAKVNLVTGDITYGEWTVVGNDTILNGNPLPPVKEYIARGGDIESSQKDIEAKPGVNITETVVYDKLGSWIPRLPEGQTNVPPTPYPNDPKDPTKPGTDKPRVPYVPGFIPVDPNGNPLKPVDPNDPTKGYEVPDVPADPTQDTPIKYIPVPTPNNGGGNNGGGGGNTPTPQPQPNPTPQPEPSPAPVPVAPEQPVAPVTPEQPAEPATPQYMDGQRELPNTGTEANSSLAALGLLGALSGFGLIARKKRKDEE